MCTVMRMTLPFMLVTQILTRLEHDSLLAIEWFQANYMKLTLIWVVGHNFTPPVGFPLITQKQ